MRRRICAVAIFPLGWVAIVLGLTIFWSRFVPLYAIIMGVAFYFVSVRLWAWGNTSRRKIISSLAYLACHIAVLSAVLVVTPYIVWNVSGALQDPLSATSVGAPPCSIRQWKVPSPYGGHVATVRVIGCSGTYDGSQDNFVFVQRSTKRAPNIHDLALNYIPNWGSWVQVPLVHWLGPDTLMVSTKANGVDSVISQRKSVSGVMIRYRLAAPLCKPSSNVLRAFFRLCG